MSAVCGHRSSDDATLQIREDLNFHCKLRSIDDQESKPFAGRRFAIIQETMGNSRYFHLLQQRSRLAHFIPFLYVQELESIRVLQPA